MPPPNTPSAEEQDQIAIAQELARRTFKLSQYQAETKIAQRIDDLDEQAAMESFLNGRVPKWLQAHHPEWAWIVIHASEFEGIQVMGEFASLIQAHLTEAP
jgi:hypothetical protein